MNYIFKRKISTLTMGYIWYIQSERNTIGVQLGSHNLLHHHQPIRIAKSNPSFLPTYGYGKNIECFLKIAIKRFQKYLKDRNNWHLVKSNLYNNSILCYDVLWCIEQYII